MNKGMTQLARRKSWKKKNRNISVGTKHIAIIFYCDLSIVIISCCISYLVTAIANLHLADSKTQFFYVRQFAKFLLRRENLEMLSML